VKLYFIIIIDCILDQNFRVKFLARKIEDSRIVKNSCIVDKLLISGKAGVRQIRKCQDSILHFYLTLTCSGCQTNDRSCSEQRLSKLSSFELPMFKLNRYFILNDNHSSLSQSKKCVLISSKAAAFSSNNRRLPTWVIVYRIID